MVKKKFNLAIVQTHATQFDGPLYAQISKNPDIDLTVYYTKPSGETTFDNEIGVNPNWGSRVVTGYRYRTRRTGFIEAIHLMRAVGNGKHNLVIIAGYLPFYHLIIAIYARFKGISTGLRSDTTSLYDNSSRRIKSLIKRKILPFIFKLYHLGHPTGSSAEEYLLKYGFKKHQIFRFPYAVDNYYLASRAKRYRMRRDLIRKTIGIGPDSFVILGVMKFVEREDPMTLIKGFSKFTENFPNAYLVLVGDGPMMKDIQYFISENSLTNVYLPGFVRYNRLPLFYSISDVFVHTAPREPWGVSVNEAMACGIPVVVANTVGSHIDLVKEGKTGFVFNVRDYTELSSCLQRLASEPQLLKEMGFNCLSLIKNWNYDYSESSLHRALESIDEKAHK